MRTYWTFVEGQGRLDWLTFFIAALATYRTTIAISRCLGPYDCFKRLRAIDRCSRLLKCPFCVSIYVAILICVLLWLGGYSEPLTKWLLLVLALSALTIVLDRTFTSDYNPELTDARRSPPAP